MFARCNKCRIKCFAHFNHFKVRSVSSSIESEYKKSILRKFLFYVHPDFFSNHKTEQLINENDLKILNQTIEIGHNANSPDTRSLIFYIKPSEVTPFPRRVKVIITKIFESLREILETIGIDLPPRPEGPPRTAFITSNPGEIDELLNSLIDR